MPDTIPVGKYYNFDNKNVDVVYNPAKDENKGGSSGGVVFVDFTISGANLTATKTAGEIFNLIMDGNTVVFRMRNGDLAVIMPCLYAENRSEYKFFVLLDNNHKAFMADTASDYPTLGNK